MFILKVVSLITLIWSGVSYVAYDYEPDLPALSIGIENIIQEDRSTETIKQSMRNIAAAMGE